VNALRALAETGAAAMVTSMATDAWQAVRHAVASAVRPHRGRPAGAAAATRPGDTQVSTAREHGTVFAVQHGNQYIHAESATTRKTG